MLIVVYDDAGYGAEFHHFTDEDHTTVRFPDVDLAAIAAGYGCAAATVRTNSRGSRSGACSTRPPEIAEPWPPQTGCADERGEFRTRHPLFCLDG
jgi:hypothetical protein